MANTVTVEGVGKVIKKMDKLGDPAVIKRAMNRSVQHIHRRIAKYPPQAPVAYRRTGTLGRGWTTKVDQGGKRGIVGNITPYAIYVQGPRQVWFHEARGWLTIEDVKEGESKAVREIFEDEYRKATK
jgi:hypothetical protein